MKIELDDHGNEVRENFTDSDPVWGDETPQQTGNNIANKVIIKINERTQLPHPI